MQPKDWLRTFLENKQLTQPHGKPLYRYRMSDAEFTSLQTTLKLLGVANLLYFYFVHDEMISA